MVDEMYGRRTISPPGHMDSPRNAKSKTRCIFSKKYTAVPSSTIWRKFKYKNIKRYAFFSLSPLADDCVNVYVYFDIKAER